MAINIPTKITNSLDGYLLDAENVKGTYLVVSDYSQLANLPSATIVNGSLAYCQNTYSTYVSGFYKYNGSAWEIWDTSINLASYNDLGGIKLGSSTQSSQTIETASNIQGRQYPIQVDSNGRASVNVPWNNTTYTAGNGLNLTGTEFSVDDSIVALQSDLPIGEVDITLNGTATQTTEVLNNIVVDDKTYTLTSSRKTPSNGGTALSLVNTGDMYTWNNKQNTLTAGNNITIQNNVISSTAQTIINGVAYREI